MPDDYLKLTVRRCGTYRGIALFEVEMAGKKNFSITLGMQIISSETLDPLRIQIDDWYLLKRN